VTASMKEFQFKGLCSRAVERSFKEIAEIVLVPPDSEIELL